MSLHRCLVALATLVALSFPTTALASDSTGQKGSIQSVEVNHSTADTFLQYHGRIVVKSGKTTTEYRWGGTSCSNKTLPEELVALLYEAFRGRKNTHITPRFQNGQGSNKCLVGFSLADSESKKSKGDDDDDGGNAPE